MTTYKESNTIESNFLSLLTKNSTEGLTKKEIIEKLSITDKYYDHLIQNLINHNLITIKGDKIFYTEPIKDGVIILKGDLLFPVSVIQRDNYTIVSRGSCYKLPKDFDIRRIIWDCEMYNNGNSKNTTLVDLLTSRELVYEKSDNKHMKEYDSLLDKMIPYSDDFFLHIKRVGAQSTDILFTFDVKLTEKNNSFSSINRFFKINSEISTGEMLTEIDKNSTERNYQNIKLNNVISIADMIFKGNEIPIEYISDKPYIVGEELKYVYIKSLKQGISFDVKTKNISGDIHTVDEFDYNSVTEGIESIMNLCGKFVNKILSNHGLILDE